MALSQEAGSDVIIAASNTQNEAFCFLYDKTQKKLVSYQNRARGGLELMGIRHCAADFTPKIREYPSPSSAKITAVDNMTKLAALLSKPKKTKTKAKKTKK